MSISYGGELAGLTAKLANSLYFDNGKSKKINSNGKKLTVKSDL